MEFWLLTIAANLIIPITMLVTGILYLKRPAKEINWMYGYRTGNAMKSQETWDFAQRYFGKLCFRVGIELLLFVLVLAFSPFGMQKENQRSLEAVMGIVEVVALVYALVPTELALKQYNKENT